MICSNLFPSASWSFICAEQSSENGIQAARVSAETKFCVLPVRKSSRHGFRSARLLRFCSTRCLHLMRRSCESLLVMRFQVIGHRSGQAQLRNAMSQYMS
ncbi:Uncharacterized protein HZ326_26749 [Fusarium oxysporum f. sp. albedinis]|nr:Uncharacterized protein HZ326_26749 [Fusarium oxysporum f. sp. albedinis]